MAPCLLEVRRFVWLYLFLIGCTLARGVSVSADLYEIALARGIGGVCRGSKRTRWSKLLLFRGVSHGDGGLGMKEQNALPPLLDAGEEKADK